MERGIDSPPSFERYSSPLAVPEKVPPVDKRSWKRRSWNDQLPDIEVRNPSLRGANEPAGYHELSEKVLGPYPELALFRRFGSLNMLNLLSLQAELTHLKKQFEEISSKDNLSGTGYSTSFRTMLMYSPGDRPEQWRLLLEIRAKLTEYSMSVPDG